MEQWWKIRKGDLLPALKDNEEGAVKCIASLSCTLIILLVCLYNGKMEKYCIASVSHFFNSTCEI